MCLSLGWQYSCPWPPTPTNFCFNTTQTLLWVVTWSNWKACLFTNGCYRMRHTSTLHSDLRFSRLINDDYKNKDTHQLPAIIELETLTLLDDEREVCAVCVNFVTKPLVIG